ncbi:HNH endonuclease, partial [Xanthobacter flavus]|uniref:HNH endonuclease n=1 Tax=Xanthobacter flavus TaxID=281 RepID=UPI00372B03FB
DGADSNRFFGAGITDEQRKVAKKTRDMMKREIGTYAEYSGLVGQAVSDPVKARRLVSIGKESVIIQWVTAATPAAAEASFFKINQAAQPIDPIERRILQSRTSPNAIASRCIVRGGRGHKYWSTFEHEIQEGVEELGAKIYDALYKPPHKQPVTSADQPIAGQGYNALPFVFDLVSLCNGLPMPKTASEMNISNALPPDPNGTSTLDMMRKVYKRIELVSTNSPGSLGFHPLVYYYAKSGNFLPSAFLASLEFSQKLDSENRKRDFTAIRRKFEDYIFENKIFVTATASRLGGGSRSLARITDLYWQIFLGFHKGLDGPAILKGLMEQPDFVHLRIAEIPSPNAAAQSGESGPSRQSKSAAFIREAMRGVVRCPLCDGAVHTNSLTFDHIDRRREGGSNHGDNLKPAHPYCNSGVKN